MVLVEILESEAEHHSSSGKFSISSIGCCWREKYLVLKGLYTPKYDEKTKHNFKIGDAFHRLVMSELFEKCPEKGFAVVTSEANVPAHKYISGRCDVILCDKKTNELILCDIKSAGDWTLNKVRNGEVPQNYIDQVQLYLHFFGIKRGYLLFVGKHKSTFDEVEIAYNQARCIQLIAEIEHFYENYVEKNVEPERCSNRMFGCVCDKQ